MYIAIVFRTPFTAFIFCPDVCGPFFHARDVSRCNISSDLQYLSKSWKSFVTFITNTNMGTCTTFSKTYVVFYGLYIAYLVHMELSDSISVSVALFELPSRLSNLNNTWGSTLYWFSDLLPHLLHQRYLNTTFI